MKRLGTRALLAAAVASAAIVLPGAPASADADTCTPLMGTMHTGAPMYGPGGPSVTTQFQISFTVGSCFNGSAPPALLGVLTGHCGAATGTGQSSGGHDFGAVWSPGVIIFDGYTDGFLGGVALEADKWAGQSCVSGANRFYIFAGLAYSFH